ncbi:hypothetical protein ACVCAH_33925 [Micromonospora sp. LZ34]
MQPLSAPSGGSSDAARVSRALLQHAACGWQEGDASGGGTPAGRVVCGDGDARPAVDGVAVMGNNGASNSSTPRAASTLPGGYAPTPLSGLLSDETSTSTVLAGLSDKRCQRCQFKLSLAAG